MQKGEARRGPLRICASSVTSGRFEPPKLRAAASSLPCGCYSCWDWCVEGVISSETAVVSCWLSPPGRQPKTDNRQRARSALFMQHLECVRPRSGEDSVQHPGHAHRLEIAGAFDAADIDDAPAEFAADL